MSSVGQQYRQSLKDIIQGIIHASEPNISYEELKDILAGAKIIDVITLKNLNPCSQDAIILVIEKNGIKKIVAITSYDNECYSSGFNIYDIPCILC